MNYGLVLGGCWGGAGDAATCSEDFASSGFLKAVGLTPTMPEQLLMGASHAVVDTGHAAWVIWRRPSGHSVSENSPVVSSASLRIR